MVRKEEEQQYSHCGQKAKDDHCITPKQKSLTTQSRECLRKEEIRSTGTTLSSNTGPQVATERGPRATAERQRDKTTTAGHGDASTYARCRWPQSRLESQRRAARRRPPRWSGTCRVWRRACLARHRLDAACTSREVSNAPPVQQCYTAHPRALHQLVCASVSVSLRLSHKQRLHQVSERKKSADVNSMLATDHTGRHRLCANKVMMVKISAGQHVVSSSSKSHEDATNCRRQCGLAQGRSLTPVYWNLLVWWWL